MSTRLEDWLNESVRVTFIDGEVLGDQGDGSCLPTWLEAVDEVGVVVRVAGDGRRFATLRFIPYTAVRSIRLVEASS